MRKKKVLMLGNTADEVVQGFLKFGEACVELQKSMEMVIQRQKELKSPIQIKFGKGDRRKNKKQFMNQINRKR